MMTMRTTRSTRLRMVKMVRMTRMTRTWMMRQAGSTAGLTNLSVKVAAEIKKDILDGGNPKYSLQAATHKNHAVWSWVEVVHRPVHRFRWHKLHS